MPCQLSHYLVDAGSLTCQLLTDHLFSANHDCMACRVNVAPLFAGKTKGSSSACSVHAGTCIVSTALQQELQQQLLSAARQAAETAQQQNKAASKSLSTSEPSPGQAPKASSSKPGKLQMLRAGRCHVLLHAVGLVWSLDVKVVHPEMLEQAS